VTAGTGATTAKCSITRTRSGTTATVATLEFPAGTNLATVTWVGNDTLQANDILSTQMTAIDSGGTLDTILLVVGGRST